MTPSDMKFKKNLSNNFFLVTGKCLKKKGGGGKGVFYAVPYKCLIIYSCKNSYIYVYITNADCKILVV